jgi:transposase InsO family protein
MRDYAAGEEGHYVWTAEGWLYVAAVVDLFSRRVVGWSMSTAMSAISWQPVELE